MRTGNGGCYDQATLQRFEGMGDAPGMFMEEEH